MFTQTDCVCGVGLPEVAAVHDPGTGVPVHTGRPFVELSALANKHIGHNKGKIIDSNSSAIIAKQVSR